MSDVGNDAYDTTPRRAFGFFGQNVYSSGVGIYPTMGSTARGQHLLFELKAKLLVRANDRRVYSSRMPSSGCKKKINSEEPRLMCDIFAG